jgi:hypothetical protein
MTESDGMRRGADERQVRQYRGVQPLTQVLGKRPKPVGINPFNKRIGPESDDSLTGVKLVSIPAVAAGRPI